MPLLLLAGRCVAEVAYEMCPVARRLSFYPRQLLSLVNLWAHRWTEVLVRTEEVSLLIYIIMIKFLFSHNFLTSTSIVSTTYRVSHAREGTNAAKPAAAARSTARSGSSKWAAPPP